MVTRFGNHTSHITKSTIHMSQESGFTSTHTGARTWSRKDGLALDTAVGEAGGLGLIKRDLLGDIAGESLGETSRATIAVCTWDPLLFLGVTDIRMSHFEVFLTA